MPRKSTNVPRFKTDAEAADWYAKPEGRRQTMEQAKARVTRAISIRIPIADLERAERIADETGVGYQTVLKRAIREGLNKAG